MATTGDVSVAKDATEAVDQEKNVTEVSDIQQMSTCHPLTLSWCFGFNRYLPIHNISSSYGSSRKMMFYVSSHNGVLYNCVDNTQTLLQGHSHPITCTSVSGDRRWIVTADTGAQCLLIVWDSYTSTPVRTLFEGLSGGSVTVAMSDDAKFVAVLSIGSPQVMTIWDWTSGSDTPQCKVNVSVDYGRQTHLVFNPRDPHQLVSNSEETAVFYHWAGDKLLVHSTTVSDNYRDFSKPAGLLTQSVFIPGTEQALTCTSDGSAIIWSKSQHMKEEGLMKAEKLLKIHDAPIRVVTTLHRFIVTGDSAGMIKFFDSSLKLMNWYDNYSQYGPLSSISFAHSPDQLELNAKQLPHSDKSLLYPTDSTMEACPFMIPDFTTSSDTAQFTHTTTNGSTVETLLDEHDGGVHALASHPTLPRLAIGGYSCKIKLWDYDKKEVLTARSFKEPRYIQCMEFDLRGEVIGIGFADGSVSVVNALTLEDVCPPFRYSRDSVIFIAFSHDSKYMATADLDLCVTVYFSQQSVANSDLQWQFLAKHRSHYKRIQGLLFGTRLDSTLPRLLSMGQDRTLVEYDLVKSSEDNLVIMAIDRIEQNATPTAFTWYPPLVKESFIFIANDEFKLKLFNSTTKMCRQTLLGPTYGSPITKLVMLPSPVQRDSDGEEIRRYLAYCTTNQVGMLLLPHDGNPHNSTCLVAHPGKVTDMCCSHDGRFLFTAGGDDCTVNMWNININGLEASSLLGGKDLEPFYSMLEGGREGEVFNELEELFYYAQIRSQSVNTSTTREVSTTVPIAQVPDIMRALGFYPSEEEVDNMVNEVKYSDYVHSKVLKLEIDLGEFLKLYINHRPVFGLSPGQLTNAFRVLGQRSMHSEEWTVHRATLLGLLQEKGEHLTDKELEEYLMTLMGCTDNPEVDGSYTEDPVTALNELPLQLSALSFAEDLLGLTT